MCTKETKPNILSGVGYITVKVQDQYGNEVFFRMKRSVKLKEVMDGYCVRQGFDVNTIRFLVDGRRLGGNDTPEKLGMEDGDQIDALQGQDGGCGSLVYDYIVCQHFQGP